MKPSPLRIAADEIDPRSLLAIVVGAHLRAEAADRPLAERLRSRIEGWIAEATCDQPLRPLICCDLWYLNDAVLQAQPTIAIGHPEVNAVSALFANRLPTAYVVEAQHEVLMDAELIDLQACLWGVQSSATAAAVETFTERYLDGFLRAAHGMRQEA